MITNYLIHVIKIAAAAAILLVAAGQRSEVRAQSIAALVNGEAITNIDIEQRMKLTLLTTKKTISRQEALDELIGDKAKIKEGKRFGLDLSAADVNSAFDGMASRMRLNSDQLSKTLENGGVRPETLKAKMKADMTWGNLVRGRFNTVLTPSEQEIRAALGTTSEASDKTSTDSFEYVMRPIVLIVPRGAAPSSYELRKKEAELLRARIETCEQAADMFRSMRDAAIRENTTKTSADLPQPLRELLDKTPIGKLTPPEVTKQGIEMVALCSRKQTAADTPAKRQIKDKLYNEKYEAKAKTYLQEVRKATMVEMR